MACKRKIYGENAFKTKSGESKQLTPKDNTSRKIALQKNSFHSNENGALDKSRTEILTSHEHKMKFAKLKTYFANLSTKISPSRIGTTIRNVKLFPSKSCDNLLCNGSNVGNGCNHGDSGGEAEVRSVGPWLLSRSKPISLRISRFKNRYHVC